MFVVTGHFTAGSYSWFTYIANFHIKIAPILHPRAEKKKKVRKKTERREMYISSVFVQSMGQFIDR